MFEKTRSAFVAAMLALTIMGALIMPQASAQPGANGGPGNSGAAHQCRDGGWQHLARDGADTVAFAREGECVSYAAQGGVLVPLVTSAPLTPEQQQCLAEGEAVLGTFFDPTIVAIHVGTDGADHLPNGWNGPDIYCSFGGDDIIGILGAGDVFFGGDGFDVVSGNSGYFYGGPGADTVTSNHYQGYFDGGPGADTVTSNQYQSYFDGGDGDDRVTLNEPKSTVYGGLGNDVVNENYGYFYGGDGNDGVIVNWAPYGHFDGGDGFDTVVYDNYGTTVNVP